jgi:hypothetical protein
MDGYLSFSFPARLKRMIWIAIRASPSKHRLQARPLPVWR